MHRGDVLAAEDLFSGTAFTLKADRNEAATKAEGVRGAKAKVAAVKSKFQSNLLSCVQLICDPDVVNGCRMLAHGHRPCWSYFTKVENFLASAKNCFPYVSTVLFNFDRGKVDTKI